MKVYYAHPIGLYGTLMEAKDLAYLKCMGFDVINPATLEYNGDMQKYIDIVKTCGAVFFRSFNDDKIGSGVALELETAREMNLPIFEIPYRYRLSARYLTRNETRARLGLRPIADKMTT